MTPSYDFDFRQLEAFCEVVDQESFSKAAASLFLSQASISERIMNLEKSLDLKLLDRMGRKVRLTSAGRLFHGQALKLLEMKRLAGMEMQFFSGLKRGRLKIGGSTIPGEYLLPGLISRFQEHHPEVSFDLSIADSGEIERLVLDGRLEIGVIGYRDVHPHLLRRELWRDELVVLVSIRHPWAGREQVSLEELRTQPLIVRERGSGTLRIMEEYLGLSRGQNTEGVKIAAQMGSSTAVKEGVRAGLGVAVLSSRALEKEIRLGMLAALRIRGVSMNRHFWLIQDERRTVSPICQAFADYALDRVREDTGHQEPFQTKV